MINEYLCNKIDQKLKTVEKLFEDFQMEISDTDLRNDRFTIEAKQNGFVKKVPFLKYKKWNTITIKEEEHELCYDPWVVTDSGPLRLYRFLYFNHLIQNALKDSLPYIKNLSGDSTWDQIRENYLQVQICHIKMLDIYALKFKASQPRSS